MNRPTPWRRYLSTGLLPRALVTLLGVPCLVVITLRGEIGRAHV